MMTVIITCVSLSIALYGCLIAAYLFVVTLAAMLKANPVVTDCVQPTCAVLIPAHNEAQQIEAAVSALHASDYPKNRFHVFVIADNCTDDTAARARQCGAHALERTEPELRGKGQALHWCLTHHPAITEQHDVVIIIDADSTVAPGFIAALAQGVMQPDISAAQANNAVENPLAGWRTALTAAAFALVNHVRLKGLTRLGASAGIKGNGMAFRTDVLRKYGWPAHSIAEDIEFGMRLVQDGYRSAYVPAAKITSPMPTVARHATAQRKRWERGRIQVVKKFVPSLTKALFQTRDLRLLGPLMELLTPPLSLLVFLQAIALVLSIFFVPFLLPITVFSLLATAAHVFLGLYHSRLPWQVWLAFGALPLYATWKLLLYMSLPFSGEYRWERTVREADLIIPLSAKGHRTRRPRVP